MNMGNRVVNNRVIIALLAGFIIGTLWLVAFRFFAWKSEAVHYHANFALYVNGQRDEFDNFTFYEEVQACGGDAINNPRTRVHMHDQKNYVVHVHDNAATWGAFFANLGYALGNNVLKTDDGIYVDGQGGKLSFILNGEPVAGVANRTIENEDVLLINYGNEDDKTLKTRYDEIPTDAGEFNAKYDPSSCSGGEGLTFSERLKEAFGF